MVLMGEAEEGSEREVQMMQDRRASGTWELSPREDTAADAPLTMDNLPAISPKAPTSTWQRATTSYWFDITLLYCVSRLFRTN